MMRAHRLLTTGLATLGVLAGGLAFTGAPAFAAAPEAPETIAATGVTATTAALHGVLNPKALAPAVASWYFAYSTEAMCAGASTTPQEPEAPVQALAVEKEVSELQPNKKYEACLVATNEAGAASTQGNQVSFTTSPAPPKIDIESVVAHSAAATLEAQVNANNEATTYVFEYATNKTLMGAKTVKGAAALGGYGDRSASVSTGAVLLPSETYYYRVLAENEQSKEEGKPVTGPVQEFTTVPAPHTEEAKSVTATSATFYGILAPLNALNTEYSFDYRVGLECAGESSTVLFSAGKGSGSREVSAAVSELQPNAQYSVCLVTSNIFGSQVDPAAPPVRFATLPAPPTVLEHSESASGVTPSEARLEAVVNPNNQVTSCEFLYGTSEASLAASAPCEPASLEGFGYQGVGATLTGLHLGTGYYYRVVALNAAHEKTEGEIAHFRTAGTGPAASTGAVSAIGQASANVTGTVNPDGLETYYYYQYGPTTEYGQSTMPEGPGIDVGAGTSQVAAPGILVPLVPGVTYHYRLVAWNETAVSYGQDKTFTTETGVPPLASTGPASGITVDEATITGTVDPQGKETSYRFEYGENTTYGTQAFGTILSEQAAETLSLNLRGISPGTTYHYRLVASNAGGTIYGEDMTFTTLPIAFPIIAPTPPPLLALPSFTFPTGTEVGTTNTGKPKKHGKKHRKAGKRAKAKKKRKRKKG